MAMEPNSNGAGLPGIFFIGLGTFLQVQPPSFMPETLRDWFMLASYASAIIYYAIKINNETTKKK
jgi:hypothetical protein